jgi:hypothetical protein
MLNPQNATHLWLLHALFLDDINQDCADFQAEWNCHPIWGPDMNDKSPKVNSRLHSNLTETQILSRTYGFWDKHYSACIVMIAREFTPM